MDSTEPSTAIPSAPPTCRNVLLTADPEPAFSLGSACITETVTGVITWAMPVPWTKKSTHSTQTGVVASNSANAARPAATSSIPTVQTARAPNRSTTSRARGAKIIWAAASGRISRPDWSALQPRTLCM